MSDNLKPLDPICNEPTWVKVKINLEKLQQLDKLEQQIRLYISRKIGMDNLRNLKIGYEGNDIITNQFTLAIRYSNND